MEKRKWQFKNNYEYYNILYEDEKYILVQNDNSKNYSFGLKRDFGTLFGFPINQSCLSKKECINTLYAFIEIDKKYDDVCKTMNIYKNMIKVLARY